MRSCHPSMGARRHPFPCHPRPRWPSHRLVAPRQGGGRGGEQGNSNLRTGYTYEGESAVEGMKSKVRSGWNPTKNLLRRVRSGPIGTRPEGLWMG